MENKERKKRPNVMGNGWVMDLEVRGERRDFRSLCTSGEPPEYHRGQVVSHQYHREHTDDGYLCQRPQSGVLGKDQRTDTDEHEDGR